MKKAFFTFCSLVSLTMGAQINFTLKATNKPTDSLQLRSATYSKWIVANKNGEFKAKLDAPDGFYQLKLMDQYTSLYIKKGNDFSATLDYNDFDKTLVYKGKGAKENNFLAKRILNQSDKEYEGAMKAPDEKSLKEAIENIKNATFSSIPKDLDATFVTEFKKNTELELAGLQQYIMQSFGLKKLNGTDSPTFAYENHDGSTTKLEDFKGKYVYIDVWATWCGPCRGEIPFLQKTEEAYHGKNIAFVSVSIDQQKDHDKWKKFVTDKNLGGVQVMADKDWSSDFVKAYAIQGIPRFILIGPDGKIINADAPRPSSPELAQLLDAVVK